MLKYGSYAFVNGNWVQTIVPASNPNPDLKWAEKKETNIGLAPHSPALRRAQFPAEVQRKTLRPLG